MTISEILPYWVQFDERDIADLRQRLDATRWPDQIEGSGWDYGTDRSYLQALCEYWRAGFDFGEAERKLNAFPQYRVQIDGQPIHFYHIRSLIKSATPLLLTHGWPGSVAEFQDVFGPLTDPVAYGGRAEDAFHVVAPSLPGFGFSGPTSVAGYGPEKMADAFARLMAALGYERYAAQGGDWGAVITTLLASLVPERLIGIHLNLMMGSLMTTPPNPDDLMDGLSPEEQRDVEDSLQFRTTENGYQVLQATKPQTASYGLNDSPAGLAGWLVEKFRGWTDCGGDVEAAFSKDQLLLNISIYWFTGTINSSMRIYYEFTGFGRVIRLNSDSGTPAPVVTVPTGHARYPKEVVRPPRSWTLKQYPNMVHWTRMDHGGHFAAMECPGPFVDDVRTFFRMLR